MILASRPGCSRGTTSNPFIGQSVYGKEQTSPVTRSWHDPRMADDPNALLWNAPPPLPRIARPGELLFEFVPASDRAPMSCELRFNGESYGWKAQFFERRELFTSHGRFVTRA